MASCQAKCIVAVCVLFSLVLSAPTNVLIGSDSHQVQDTKEQYAYQVLDQVPGSTDKHFDALLGRSRHGSLSLRHVAADNTTLGKVGRLADPSRAGVINPTVKSHGLSRPQMRVLPPFQPLSHSQDSWGWNPSGLPAIPGSPACKAALATQDDKCASFLSGDGCEWTKEWNCPGQSGGIGKAGDDGSLGYLCCCTRGYWKNMGGNAAAAVSQAPPREAVSTQTMPAPTGQTFGGPPQGQTFGGPAGPPAGQQSYGGPPTGQSSYGGPPSGQNSYGGPPTGQNSYGGPPTGPSYGGPPAGQTFGGPRPAGETFGGPPQHLAGKGKGNGKGRGVGRGSGYGDYSGPSLGLQAGEDPFEHSNALKQEADKVFGETNTGINFDAYDDIPVETSGRDVPPSINAFSEMQLPDGLLANIERCKFTKPTPVQKYSLPIAKAGRDLMACAQTGSGKTAGFMFPIIAEILGPPITRPPRQYRFCPQALIIAPTRELVLQIHEEGNKFAYRTGLGVRAIYGGAPAGPQIREMRGRGVDILVATPGRLEDLIGRGLISLAHVKYLCLDEADRMLDMGFEPAIRNIVERMDMPRTGERQTMMFSATFPKEIQRLAMDFLNDYIFLTVGRVGSSTDLIKQEVQWVESWDKRNKLLETLRSGVQGLQIIFTQTKREADSLEFWLSCQDISSTAIHGDKEQRERERSLRMFKTGEKSVLVATDVAARGLDIPHVEKVINYELPSNIDDYIHRIGRTGRAGKKGLAVAFFDGSRDTNLAPGLVEAMEDANQEVPDWLRDISPAPKRKKKGGARFGGQDFRQQPKDDWY